MDPQTPADNPPEPADLDLAQAGDAIAALIPDAPEPPAVEGEDAPEPPDQPQTPEPESPDQPALADVEYEGKKYQLPPELKDALLRQADYTRKTQELAQERQKIEPLYEQGRAYAQAAQKLGPLLGQYQLLNERLSQFNAPEVQQRLDALQASDPLAYFQARDEQRKVADALTVVRGQLEAATVEMQKAERDRLANLVQEGHKILVQKIPNWGPDRLREFQGGAAHYGYSAQELNSVVDHRALLVLHDALQWRALQDKAPQVTKQVKAAPPKPVKGNPAPEQTSGPQLNQAAMQRLKRTGDLADATAAIASLLK